MVVTGVIDRDPDGGYCGRIPAFRGVVAGGNTLRQTRQQLREAAQLWVDRTHAHDEKVPKDRRPGRIAKTARVVRIRVRATEPRKAAGAPNVGDWPTLDCPTFEDFYPPSVSPPVID